MNSEHIHTMLPIPIRPGRNKYIILNLFYTWSKQLNFVIHFDYRDIKLMMKSTISTCNLRFAVHNSQSIVSIKFYYKLNHCLLSSIKSLDVQYNIATNSRPTTRRFSSQLVFEVLKRVTRMHGDSIRSNIIYSAKLCTRHSSYIPLLCDSVIHFQCGYNNIIVHDVLCFAGCFLSVIANVCYQFGPREILKKIIIMILLYWHKTIIFNILLCDTYDFRQIQNFMKYVVFSLRPKFLIIKLLLQLKLCKFDNNITV